MVPESPWLEAMMETASPRRRSNQCVTLAISGVRIAA